MKQKVGLIRHFPPLTSFLKAYVIVVPVMFFITEKWPPPDTMAWGWIAMFVGLLCMGWLLQVLRMVADWLQRVGYESAISDLRLLCVGYADFRDGYPENERDLLAAAIVTLEVKA